MMDFVITFLVFMAFFLLTKEWDKKQSGKAKIVSLVFTLLVAFVSIFTFLGPILTSIGRTTFVTSLVYHVVLFGYAYALYFLGIVLYKQVVKMMGSK